MARPRTPTGPRPPCPRGHAGDVWLDGFYGRAAFQERPRYLCVPRLDPVTRKRPPLHVDGSRAHKYIEPLPRRHQNAKHPHGSRACLECEHVLDRHEGPQTPRRQQFSVREVADALVAIGHGRSLRRASQAARDSAQRLVIDQWGHERVSRHGQLTADQLAMFGVIVRDELMPDEWPEAVAVDETSITVRLTETDQDGEKQTRSLPFYILGVFGYPSGRRGSGRAVRLAITGAKDQVEWERVLRSRRGAPKWVVCDQGTGLMAAIKSAWPSATIYQCEAHLRMNSEKALVADGVEHDSSLWAALRKAIGGRRAWEELREAAKAAGAVETLGWMRENDALMDGQWAVRDKDRPLSIGALETVFQTVEHRIGDRRYVFRNHRRLELILDLIALDLAGLANTYRYRQILRDHLLANGGRPVARRRSLDDVGGSSLLRVIAEAERRLARRREQNARAQRAWVARQKAAGKPKRRPPSRRPRRRRDAVH